MNDPYPTDPSPARLKSTVDYHDPDAAPPHIGRYRVQRILGKGGFGLVYLAHDEQLQRLVAIKVAHARLIEQPSDAEAYLAEARTVASLDHPNIVPVYDVGGNDEFPCFVVSKYIDGTDLFTRLRQSRLAVRDQAEQRRKATHAAGLVHAVLNADTAQTPAIIDEMVEYRKWTDALLRNESQSAAANSRQQLHASLALLPVDPGQVDYLYARLLVAQPQEVAVLRDALEAHKDGLLDKLWAVVEAPQKAHEPQRLRAAAALAKYDPESEKWAQAQELVGDNLVTVPAVYLSLWMQALRPVRTKLLPQLSAVYRDAGRPSVERSLATDILADYAADDAHTLADLLMDADDHQFAAIFLKLKERGEQGLPFLSGEIDINLPADLPSSDEKREKLAKRQASAAVALLRMNQAEKVWPLLKHSPDPRVRSYLIHRLATMGADAEAILKRLDEEPDISVRRALLLSLGEFSETQLLPAARASLLPKLQAMYRTDTDAGLHAAAEWLLRSWRQDDWLKQVNDEWANDKEQRNQRFESIRQLVKQDNQPAPPQWYVNSQGQTMVVVTGPGEFLMGSPASEADRNNDEVQHRRRIGRSFAIASKSVTLDEYRSLTKDAYEIGEKFTRYPDLPVVGINWYMAAKYCNLLSEEEGFDEAQWCYEVKDDEIGLKSNYLGLTGYRLPSEAEMEYATRAHAATSRYYGETEELLAHYAWYTKNSNELVQRVGLKKPNDFGLFDVQGNCYTWCQEAFDSYPVAQEGQAVDDKEVENLVVVGTKSRVLRGGSFDNPASAVRSACRSDLLPSYRAYNVGFRVARTLPLAPLTSLPPTRAAGRR